MQVSRRVIHSVAYEEGEYDSDTGRRRYTKSITVEPWPQMVELRDAWSGARIDLPPDAARSVGQLLIEAAEAAEGALP